MLTSVLQENIAYIGRKKGCLSVRNVLNIFISRGLHFYKLMKGNVCLCTILAIKHELTLYY